MLIVKLFRIFERQVIAVRLPLLIVGPEDEVVNGNAVVKSMTGVIVEYVVDGVRGLLQIDVSKGPAVTHNRKILWNAEIAVNPAIAVCKFFQSFFFLVALLQNLPRDENAVV
jgi:hypothetical protein